MRVRVVLGKHQKQKQGKAKKQTKKKGEKKMMRSTKTKAARFLSDAKKKSCLNVKKLREKKFSK